MDSLGKILLARNIISREQLGHILTLQKRSHSRLGDIIIAEGITCYLELYSALAEHYNLEFINLLQTPPDYALLSSNDIDDYIRLRVLPWQQIDGKIIIALTEYSQETLEWIAHKFGKNTELVVTSPLDIRKTIERVFGNFMEKESKLRLWKLNPKSSARTTISFFTKIILYIVAIFMFVLLSVFPIETSIIFIAVCCILYFFSMLVKILIFIKGCKESIIPDWKELFTTLDDSSLPVYTILVPMHKEVASLPHLLSAMNDMDYPVEKLDIKLVLEADDIETIDALLALKPGYNFEIVRVPASSLRTKPKACNYALAFARGEYVTVFDVDDIPDPMQLKKSIITFRMKPDNVACLQARLSYYNGDDNWLTRFFTLEYSILFDVMMRGFERMNIPLPLGGTSNHISLANLHKLGQWDAYNVTEDADLGIRLATRGFHTIMFDSQTDEESPIHIMAWIRQRSRWIKGYMQTWLVHMRDPVFLYRTLGGYGFWGFQFFIGFSCFTFLSAPFLWLFALLWWLLPLELVRDWLPDWLLLLALVNLLLNFIIHWFMVIYCISLRKGTSISYKIATLFYPFYLLLHSIASYIALYQLIVKPHFWEKTTHGLAKTFSKKSIRLLS